MFEPEVPLCLLCHPPLGHVVVHCPPEAVGGVVREGGADDGRVVHQATLSHRRVRVDGLLGNVSIHTYCVLIIWI